MPLPRVDEIFSNPSNLHPLTIRELHSQMNVNLSGEEDSWFDEDPLSSDLPFSEEWDEGEEWENEAEED